MEWLRLVTIFIGLLISLPVFFLGTLIIIIIIIIITLSGNLIRLFKIGLRLFHVKTRTSPPACLQDPRSDCRLEYLYRARQHFVCSAKSDTAV